MKVVFKTSFSSIFGDHQPSDAPTEIPDAYAANWIDVGFAEAVEEEKPKPKRTRKTASDEVTE